MVNITNIFLCLQTDKVNNHWKKVIHNEKFPCTAFLPEDLAASLQKIFKPAMPLCTIGKQY